MPETPKTPLDAVEVWIDPPTAYTVHVDCRPGRFISLKGTPGRPTYEELRPGTTRDPTDEFIHRMVG